MRLPMMGSPKGATAVLLSLMFMIITMANIAGASSLGKLRKAGGSSASGGNGGGSKPSLTTYDQRQTGKYNIHVNIKDVQIISVDGDKFDGEFGDDTIYDYGDYDYDPSHLTVNPLPIFGGGGATSPKPPKSTTKTPVSITSTKKTTTSRPTATTTTAKPTSSPMIVSPIKGESNSSNKPDEFQALSAPGVTLPPPSNIYIFKPTPNYHPSPVHYDYQEIPVEVIVEPVLKPKYRNANPQISVAGRRNRYRKNSIDMGRNNQQQHVEPIEAIPSGSGSAEPETREPLEATPCRHGEFRDRAGKCRTRRSGIYYFFSSTPKTD
ncbi:Krueppel-like factor 12 isoform X2 [Uranotaenia lowii]|uniref:Krueppel-like factor 12 isoform X2 n=1 Tax=Uranotaenia lowii TaxID=190385 RepID=UPI00247A1F0E|nr:Krueppel-like factor 12 isoform X2 [Uranotaenia lowii]